MPRPEIIEQYLTTVGIECHVQLNTMTKLFSGASNDDRDKAPNTVVSPICFGLPGTLPVLNERAVELAIKAGLALNAEIAKISSFDRKHYFYPDLPKGYQITQLHRPTILGGKVEVPVGDRTVTVRVHHAHLEEDAGKSVHPAGANYSLVDLNRAGTPLIEIVSEPDMHSAAEAKAYAQELYLLMKYAGVTLGDLSHGNMRFDVNVSVAKKEADKLGTKVEVKNLNSFRSVERAVEFEVARQVELLEKGEAVKQETRGWEEATQKTTGQRSKEEAQDYRYFPEADLPPIELTEEKINEVRSSMPRLPDELREQLNNVAGIDRASVNTLILNDVLTDAHYVDTVLKLERVSGRKVAIFAANFFVHRDLKYRQDKPELNKRELDAEDIAVVYGLFEEGKLSSNNADQLLYELKAQEADPVELAESEGLIQENDESALGAIIDRVLANPTNHKAAEDVKNGEMKAIGFLVGQVMKASGGKANPGTVSAMLRQKLQP